MENEQKYCDRCKKAASDSNLGFESSEHFKKYLKKTNYDCICKDCHEVLEKLIYLTEKYPFSKNPLNQIEGIHYYIENENLVFTEFNHIARGYCCRSGCRHCAYGFKKLRI